MSDPKQVRSERERDRSREVMPAKQVLHIAVIGAGAVGLSTALHLRRDGHAIDVFDLRDPGAGASFGNAGIIAVSEVLPLGRPSTLRQLPRMLLDRSGPLVVRASYLPRIAPWLARLALAARPSEMQRISRALATLLRPALDAWREILAGTTAGDRLVSSGWLRVFDTRESLERAKPDIALQRRLGVDVRILSPGEIADLEPALARNSFAGASFCTGVAHLNSPFRTMQALADRLVQDGGRIHRRTIRAIERGQPQPTLVDDHGARMVFDRVVVAAGAWSRKLIRTAGFDVQLDTERGYHVMLPSPSLPLRRPVTVANPGYSLVPMEDGLRLTSGVEFAGLEAPADFRRIHRMADHARRVLPGLTGPVQTEWLGFRPSMPRSLPVIGSAPGDATICLAFGHGHLGVTLGPITGRIVADLIGERPPSVDLLPFAPGST